MDSEATDEQIGKALDAAAFRDPSLHAASYKINAPNVHLAGTRGGMCAGFALRLFFQFLTLPRSFSVLRTDQVEEGALGTILAVHGEGGSCSVPPRRSRGTDECSFEQLEIQV